jgi:transcriptional regulator with XRE-family HTH domain
MERITTRKANKRPHPVMRFFAGCRAEMGWSQQLVADHMGINQSTVSDLETGVTQRPDLETVAKMANGYGYQVRLEILDADGNVAYVWSGGAWPEGGTQDFAECT